MSSAVGEAITVSQMWHPRLDADPAHGWLRGLVLATGREAGRQVSAPRENSDQ